MLLTVVGVPEFGGHPKLISGTQTFSNGPSNTLTHLRFVAIIRRTV